MLRLFWVSSILLLAACGTTNVDREFVNKNPPKTQYEAGRIQIATQPPLVWYDVVERLDPNFPVTSAQTFIEMALPITSRNLALSDRSFSAGLGLDFGGSDINSTRTLNDATNTPADGPPVTTSSESFEQIETRNSGTPPELTVADAARLAFPEQTSPFGTDELGTDPRLLYREAAGIYQDVQLLNAYLEADVTRDTHVPFLFRTQLSVQPFARGMPYDVYSELRLDAEFPSFKDKKGNIITYEEGGIIRDEEGKIITYEEGGIIRDEEGKIIIDGNVFTKFTEENVRVIPLIILDNTARSAERRLVSAARQLNFSVAAVIQGIGGRGAVRDLNRQLRDLAALDLNSVLLPGQSSDKNLSIRVGAIKSPNGDFAMTARNYDVSFLVLVPEGELLKDKAEVDLYNFSTMRNTKTGRRIPLITDKVEEREIDAILDLAEDAGLEKKCRRLMEYNLTDNKFEHRYSAEELAELREKYHVDDCVLRNTKRLHSTSIENGAIAAFLFIRYDLKSNEELFQRVRDYTQLRRQYRTSIELPEVFREVPDLDKNSVAVVTDRAGSSTLITQDGYQGVSVRHHKVRVQLEYNDTRGHPRVLPAHRVSISNDGRLEAEFPTLSGLGLIDQVILGGAKLKVSYSDFPGKVKKEGESEKYSLVRNNSSLQAAPRLFNMTALPARVAMNNGQGTVTITTSSRACPAQANCTGVADYVLSFSNYPLNIAQVMQIPPGSTTAAPIPVTSERRDINGFVFQPGHRYQVTFDQIPNNGTMVVTGMTRNAQGGAFNSNQTDTATITFVEQTPVLAGSGSP